MYDLNSAFNQAQGNSEGSSREFKSGVEICRMRLSKRNEIYFRILPAFGAANVIDDNGVVTVKNRQGWDYFRNANDPRQPFTAWARVLYSYNFIGHGQGSDGRRITIIAPKSFGGDGQHYDPVEELRKEAKRDPMWKYLTEDIKAPDGTVIARASLPFLSTDLIFNMVDLNELQKGVQLGILSKSGMDALLSDKGLANQRNFSCTEEMARTNPMLLWNCGDLTNPQTGPVLKLRQEQGKGKFNAYVVDVAINQNGTGFQTYPITLQMLEKRNVLEDPMSFMARYSPQDIVNMLVKVLDGVNPQTRESELVLLHRVFGTRFELPEIPVTTTRTATQAGGFGAPMWDGATPAFANSFTPPPGGIPGLATPQSTFTPPGAGFSAPVGSIPGLASPVASPAGIPGLITPPVLPPGAGPVPQAGKLPYPVGAQTSPAAQGGLSMTVPANQGNVTGLAAAYPSNPVNVPGAPIHFPGATFQEMLLPPEEHN